MIDSAIFIGKPLLFNNIKIYPPKINEVVCNPLFNTFYKFLTYSQEDIQDELKGKIPEGEEFPTPLEFLIVHCQFVDGYANLAQGAFKFFCGCDINFDFENKAILLSSQDGQGCLNESNYFDFQNFIRRACGDKPVKPPEPFDPDEDPRIRRIKEKARERDRIKAKQGNKSGISFDTCLVAICCMGIGITPLNIGEMSYAAVGPLMKVMQDKEKYDIDIRSLLAGADSKKVKPKYWIRNSDKD